MLNEIVDAAVGRLEEIFPEITVYTDDMEQGFAKPCFFISLIEPSEKPMIGHRYYRKTDMLIRYVPGDNVMANREINSVADRLFDEMEYIVCEDGSRLRGTNRSFKAVNGVLNFFVNYNMYIIRKPAEDPESSMDGISLETNLKKENLCRSVTN